MSYDYYRGSSSYEDAVKNRLNALAVTGAATTRAVRRMESELRDEIQAGTNAIHDLQDMYIAGTNATLNMQQEIRNDIQTNTNAIQDMAFGIRSDIRESTYALVASQSMLTQTFRHSFNALANTLNLNFGMVSNKLDAMSDRICSKLDEIHDILNNPRLTESRELYRNALTSYEKGFYEEALEDCKAAVEKNKTDFISWHLLGHIYMFGAGKFSNVIDIDKAEEAFFNAAKYIDPDIGHSEEANTLASEIYYYLGYSRLVKSNDFLVENRNTESQQKLEEAKKASSEAYRLSNRNLPALYELAKELHFLEQDDESLNLLEQLIRADKYYAIIASTDKNFESLWPKIEDVIKRLSSEIISSIMDKLSEYAAQADKICSISTETFLRKIEDYHSYFANLKSQLPNRAYFENKDYFTVRDLYEKGLPDYKKPFEDAVASVFFGIPHSQKGMTQIYKEVASKAWSTYNQAVELHASGSDEDCLEILKNLILDENIYFAIKATCDKSLKSLWGRIESFLKETKQDFCQQIRERVEEAITVYETELNTNKDLYYHPIINADYKTCGEGIRHKIESFRDEYEGIEKEDTFSVLEEYRLLDYSLESFEEEVDAIKNEALYEIREEERKREIARIEEERKREIARKEEERKRQEAIEESERKKQKKRTTIKNTFICLFSTLILSFIVLLEYVIVVESNGMIGKGIFAWFIGSGAAYICAKNRVTTITFLVCWAIATVIMFSTGHPIVAIINILDFLVLIGEKESL